MELIGRDRECATIDTVLARAKGGRVGALLIRGEAGIGKSALLEYARESADGFTMLRANGVESEAELPSPRSGKIGDPVSREGRPSWNAESPLAE
jgi:predicted ATP-dependent serine protease